MTIRHKSSAIKRYRWGFMGSDSISANPDIVPKINIGRLRGRINTAPRIAALLAPNTSPEAMPPSNVIPSIPSKSDSAISKYKDELMPIIKQITGKIISKGKVVTKKKQKHFAAA